MNSELHSTIFAKLQKAVPEDDIIFSVCKETDLDWNRAQALVEEVKKEHYGEIETSQVPLKSVLALVYFTLGIILIIAPFIYLWLMLDLTQTLILVATGQVRASDSEILNLIWRRCLLLGWFQIPSILFTAMTGVAIVLANLRYMRDN